MKSKMAITVLIFLALTSFVDKTSFSQQIPIPKYECRVQLSVSASEDIKSILQSYLARELRSLGDISLVDDEADFKVIVIGMNTYSDNNTMIGYTIATTIVEPFDNQLMLTFLRASTSNPNIADTIDKLTKNLCIYHTTIINTDSDLKRLSGTIVANFDSDYVEADRKLHREIHELTDKTKNQ
jgi:hypothetical protein